MSESWYDWGTAKDRKQAAEPASALPPRERVTAFIHSAAAARILLALILVVAAYLRLSHVDWDDGTHIHPDERFLTMVESAMRLPTSVGEFFDSTKSPLNPYNYDQFPLFVYGTLPIFIVRVVAEFANKFNETAHLWMAAPGIPVNLVGYDGVHFVGRALSGIFDLLCVWLLYIVGTRLYKRPVGLLAAALYAFAVLPLQQSHFFTVDTFGNFFALLTFYFAVRVAQGGEPGRRGGGWPSYVALGASLGATIACRINLLPMLLIAVFAAGIRAWDDWHASDVPLSSEGTARHADVVGVGSVGSADRSTAWLATLIQATLFRLALMAVVAIVAFRIFQPYAFGGTKFTDFSFSQHWLDNMKWAQQSQAGDIDMPPGHQWASRTPFVFPFTNMVIWGLGVPLGLAAWAGWLIAFLQIARGVASSEWAMRSRRHLLPVAWIGGMFLWQGLQYVQSMRYLLPIYPMLAMLAAWLLVAAVDWTREHVVGEAAPRWLARVPFKPLAYGLLTVVTVFTVLWGWGFLAIYRRPLSRVSATRWIYQNIPDGSVLANEHWDDPLPFSIDGKMSFKPAGMYNGLKTSPDGLLDMYNEDTVEKREQLYQWLNETDYIIMSSNRLYGSIPRLPMRYPMTTLYYKLLFEGKLGFKQVLKETSFPTIFGVQFDDSGAEEAFSVYDHPVVYIFQKTPDYSEANVRRYLDAVDLEETVQMWPKQVSQAPTALLLPAVDAIRQRAGGTWSSLFQPQDLANRVPVLLWLLLIEALGVVAFPIAFVVLRTLSDRGYGVAKVLGVLLLAWLSWLGPSLKLVGYERWEIALVLAALAAAALAVAWPRRAEIGAFLRTRRALLLTEEVLFLVLFGLFLFIRWGNPDLWHPARGGEKPMDFAYLNAVIKSTTFPPYDPWFAGGFLDYYYFGFVIVGTLIKLTGIVPAVAYNLAVPTLFALTGLGAFAVVYNLAAGDHATTYPSEPHESDGLPVGPLLGGLAGTLCVAFLGNLGEVKLLWDQWSSHATTTFHSAIPGLAGVVRLMDGLGVWISGKAPLSFPNDWWFWNASRIIPDTINEFPFFTFTYADLHAHMIALPVTLLALATAVALVRLAGSGARGDGPALMEGASLTAALANPWRIPLAELWPILLFGLIAGALRATNTWDFPTYLLVALVALSILEATRRSCVPFPAAFDERLAFIFRGVVGVIWRMIILVGVATLAFYPYTKTYATAYAGLQPWQEATTTIGDYLLVHGIFLALVTIYLLGEWWAQSRRADTPMWLQEMLPFIMIAVVCVMLASLVLHIQIWLIALPLFTFAVVLAFGRSAPPARRLALLLIALALAITMGVEVVRQKDDIGRMNTVFKFYVQAWTLFGVGAAFGLASWSAAAAAGRWAAWARRLAWGVALVLFLGGALYPAFAAKAKVADRFSAEDQPHTLNGMAYMDTAQYADNERDMRIADDKLGIEWMLENVQGSPVILEGNTPNYRWGNRFSIYTGLPAVMGWDWHEKQQRSVVPGLMIDRRLNHVKEMYSTTDVPRAEHLLDYYAVSYVIVGELERAYYPPEGLAKFDGMVSQGYLRLAYNQGSVRIYQVTGRGTKADLGAAGRNDVLLVPAPGAAAQ
jgi:YYY domain-containing protein